MMIIFVVNIGFDGRSDRSGDIDVILFETKAQCEFALSTLEEKIPFNWGRGEGEDRKLIEVGYSVECFDLPADAQTSLRSGGSIDTDGIARRVLESLHTEEPEMFEDPQHKRWDNKRWNE